MSTQPSGDRIDQLFEQACELPKDQVADFLNQHCRDDEEHQAVERLLKAHQRLQENPGLIDGPIAPNLAEGIEQAAREADREEREKRAGQADRNLLYAIVALQMNFVTRDELIKAMHDWVIKKTVPVEHLLRADGAIEDNTMRLLTELVDKHLQHHNHDVEASLRSLATVGRVKRELTRIPDDRLEESVSLLQSGDSEDGEHSTVVLGQPSSTGERFRILRFHDEGGMARVSLARDAELNREVAFKEIKDVYAENPEYQARLNIEAEITGGLEHPGIVPVYGLGAYDDGRPFYCMRFIKGSNLKSAIEEYRDNRERMSISEQNLELRRLLRRFIDVCEAINYAHSRQVLHRDLKPGNVMLGRYGETLVVDWGLAKALGTYQPESTEETQPLLPRSGSSAAPTIGTVGTPEYMSPEQAQGDLDGLGPATDVFSLGATLFCLLTGRSPYRVTEYKDARDKQRKTLKLARDCDHASPRDMDPTIPAALEAICLKAMDKDPDHRYATPQDVADDIERWLADEPVSAYRDPWIDRFARTVRRHRTAVAGVSAVLLTGLIALAVVAAVLNQGYRTERALNAQLAEANRLSERDFRDTRRMALSLVGHAERELSQTPGTESLRQTLTNLALDTYREFYDRRSVDDPDLRRDMAQLYRASGALDRFYARHDEAADKFAASILCLRQLLEDVPDDPEILDLLAETLTEQAHELQITGSLEESEPLIEEADSIATRLLEQSPESAAFMRTAARVAELKGSLAYEYAEFGQALKQFKEMSNYYVKLTAHDQSKITDNAMLVASMIAQGMTYRELGQLSNARKALTDAFRQSDRSSDWRFDRNLRASAHLELAKVQSSLKETPSARIEYLLVAESIWTTLTSEFPESLIYQQSLATTLAELALCNAEAENTDGVNTHLNRAKVLVDGLIKERYSLPSIHEDCAHVFIVISKIAAKTENPKLEKRSRSMAIDQLTDAYRLSTQSIRIGNQLKELQNLSEYDSDL